MARQPRDPNAPKKTRAPSKPKPAYFILQVMDAEGNAIPFNKAHVKLIAVERHAEKVLEAVESGVHQHSFYIRGMLPVARREGAAA